MLSYFIRRILYFIPTLLGISIVYFFLSKTSPGDPALNRMESSMLGNRNIDLLSELQNLKKLKEGMGLNKPNFYFNINRQSKSDTLYLIANNQISKNLNELAYEAGSWEEVNYYFSVWKKEVSRLELEAEATLFLKELIQLNSWKSVRIKLSEIDHDLFIPLKNAVNLVQTRKYLLKNYMPSFTWNGFDNQYHNWLVQFLSGNLGKSYTDGTSVSFKVTEALKTTLLLSIIAIFISFLIAIPLAIHASSKINSSFDKFVSTLLYSFYALPTFWIATLLIIYFGGGDYLNWFPSYGLGKLDGSETVWELIQIRSSHLVLPIFCLTYGSITVIFKQLKNAMIRELQSDYAKTAFSKGLSKQRILYFHVLKNASFPLITLAGRTLPAIVSGAFIVEFIFSINGMGKLTLDSFLARDYPVIFGILMLASFLTLFGVWLADISYYLSDPRLTINSKKT